MPFRDGNTATMQAFHHWSNRTHADEQALVEEAVRSHRTLRGTRIRSICRT